MNLDDLKDRLRTEWGQLRERLEESSAFNNLRDRYQDLNPTSQKALVIGGLVLIALILLSVPWAPFETSRENMTQFEDKRGLMRDLLRVQKEINETPNIAVPPPAESVKGRIQSDLQTAQLMPEQIRGVSVLPATASASIGLAQSDGSVEVSLAQLNLKQIVDLGYQFQSIDPSVKMKDLIVHANALDARYFDVIYRLVVLKVTQEEAAPAEEPPPKKKGRGR